MPITGTGAVCTGLTEQLIDVTNGGIWSLSNTHTATIGSSSGIVTGIASGTVIISYTLGSGCNVVAPLVVNPLSPVIGVTTVCIGLTTNLSDTTVGGVWSSSNGNATVNAVTGFVTGVHAGTSVITYTLPTACAAITTVTILPLPAPITGPNSVCDGQVITLSDVSPGSVWSSSNPTVAAIDPLTGVLTAGPSGITVPTPVTIVDFASGCPQTATITVNPLTSPILGNTNICLGLTSALSDATHGGIWSSSNTSVATIDPVNGLVTTVGVGNTTIVYTPPTGCTEATIVTVNALPTPITGVPIVCQGSTTQLSDGVGGGAWLSSNPSIANVNFSTGLVTGVNPGSAVITNLNGSGCVMSITVTVNPLPTAIGGLNNVCVGSQVTLVSGTGGTWSSTSGGIATIGSLSGVVTGLTQGTSTISYTLSTGCAATLLMTVNPLPAPITGITTVCTGNTTQLFDATSPGVWSSSAPSVMTIDPTLGTVTGIAASGSSIIDYTLPTGCYTATVVTIATPPTAISAASADVCVGAQLIVTNGTPGGTWSSSNTFVATITPPGTGVTGTVNGASQGFAAITYTLGGGTCSQTYGITVDPLPAPITGIQAVCAGLTTQLFDATTPGSWSSVTPALATVDASGLVTGVTAGPAVIVYTLPTTCAVTATVTVNPLPDSITGNKMVCFNGTRTLSDASSVGTWSSSNPAITTVGLTTGIVYGNQIGVDTITYTISATGCIMTTTVSVQPLPLAFNVNGGGPYCEGAGGIDVGLDSSQTGVEYYLYLGSTPTGTFAGTGHPMNFGPQIPAGTYTVVGDNTFTTCSINMIGSVTVVITPTVTPTVSILTGGVGDTVCAGTAVNYTTTVTNSGASPSYEWTVNGVNLSTGSSYSFTPANNDVVQVIMRSSLHCAVPDSAIARLTMDVITPVTPSVGILESPGDTVCIGTGVTFTAIPSAGGPAPTYQWTVNSGLAGTGPVLSYIPNNGDVVYVTMVSNYLCRLSNTAQSANVILDVQTPVIPIVTITASPGLLIAQGESDTLTANVTNGYYPVYQWFVNGIPIAGATNSTFVSNTLNTPKDDSVGCQVTNRGACNESAFGWVYIEVHSLKCNTGGRRPQRPECSTQPEQGFIHTEGHTGHPQ